MKNIIESIESLHVSTEREIRSEFEKQVKKNKDEIPKNLKAELMAFHFSENNTGDTNYWGTYFGPEVVWNNDDGTVTESPSIKVVNEETIEYWSGRINKTANPLLKARYAGLVWDFSKPILKLNPDYKIGLLYVENLIEVVEKRLQKEEFNLITKVKRALQVAVSLNALGLIERAKNATIDLEDDIGVNEKPGLWGFSYDLLVGHKKIIITDKEEDTIINKLQERFNSLIAEEEPDPWVAEAAAERLAKHYRRKNNLLEAKKIILRLGKVYEAVEKKSSVIQTMSQLQHLHKIYVGYNLKKEANEILVRLREIGPKIKDEMNLVSTSVDIPASKITQIVNSIVDGEPTQIFYNIIRNFIPDTKSVKTHLLEFVKTNPLSYIIPHSVHDSKGRVVATIGSFNEDYDGHLVSHLSRSLSIDGLFLRKVFEKIFEESVFNQNDIISFINVSPVFKENRICIIEKGIDAFFNHNLEVAMHLLIPQIEEAIRNFVEITNGVVIKKNEKSGGFQLKTLHELLGDDIVKQVFGGDCQLYLKVLLTDQRGWNLRNDVCHGMCEPDAFSPQSADRIIHVLLILGSLRETEKDTTDSDVVQK